MHGQASTEEVVYCIAISPYTVISTSLFESDFYVIVSRKKNKRRTNEGSRLVVNIVCSYQGEVSGLGEF